MSAWISALEVYVFRPPPRRPDATFNILARLPIAPGIEVRFTRVNEGRRRPSCEVATWRRDARGTWQRSEEPTIVPAAEWDEYCRKAEAYLEARYPWLSKRAKRSGKNGGSDGRN